MENRIRHIWKDGGTALNAWLNIGHSFSAEIMAAQDFDALTIDAQHGPLDYTAVLPMLQAMRGSGKTLMARVPWRDPTWIMKFLDAGAMGIICPMVNNAEQAEEFVSYLRFPPHGQRSWGPTRAGLAYPGYEKDEVNASVLAFAMIETAEALDNLDEIAATRYLDALYIGPSDLSVGMSNGALKPGLDREEPEVIDTLHMIAETAKKHGIRAALHCGSPEYAARATAWGFDLLTIASDNAILARGAASTIATVRGALQKG